MFKSVFGVLEDAGVIVWAFFQLHSCLSLKTDTLTKAAVLSKQCFNVSIKIFVLASMLQVCCLCYYDECFHPSVCTSSTLLGCV